MRLFCVWILLAAAALAAEGEFAGKWSSAETGSGGDLRIVLAGEGSLTFTFEGQEVRSKVEQVRFEKDSGKFTMRYRFQLGDVELVSVAEGTVKDSKIEGRYQTSSPDGGTVDRGTFQGTASK